jgi:hypothetical protein
MLGSWALRLLPIIFGTKHYLISAQLMITNDLLTHEFLDRRFFWGREIPPTPEQRVLAELANLRAEWAERERSWWAERAEWVEKEKGWGEEGGGERKELGGDGEGEDDDDEFGEEGAGGRVKGAGEEVGEETGGEGGRVEGEGE